jgi:hypothetical protein
MEAALHQKFRLASPNQLHGFCGRRLAVRSIYDAEVAEIDSCGLGNGLDKAPLLDY